MDPSQLNNLLTIPADKAFVSIKPEEAAFLYRFVRERDLGRTLETGLGFGRSAVHLMAAHEGMHVAVDPFQADYEYGALANVAAAGFSGRFEFYEDDSQLVLPALAREGRTFDFIFIDGDHKFDGILVDFYFADRLLETGGYVFFHDTWMRSTQLAAAFIRRNKANYEAVPTPFRNFAAFKKTAASDGRDGMHFREFYTWRALVRFRLISWLLQPGDSVWKRLVRRLKDALR